MNTFFRKVKIYEHKINLVAIALTAVTLVIGGMWIADPSGNYEPTVFTLGTFAAILFSLPTFAAKYSIPKLTFDTSSTVASPQYFIGNVLTDFAEAEALSKKKNVPIFLVIYDKEHPTKSKLNYSLGYFTEYSLTKRLINENFIQAIVPSTDTGVKKLIPADDPLENCLLVVLSGAGEIIRREGVYANPDEGLKRTRQIIEKIWV